MAALATLAKGAQRFCWGGGSCVGRCIPELVCCGGASNFEKGRHPAGRVKENGTHEWFWAFVIIADLRSFGLSVFFFFFRKTSFWKQQRVLLACGCCGWGFLGLLAPFLSLLLCVYSTLLCFCCCLSLHYT